jgi:hypothetical protein
MTSKEFTLWLKGFITACNEYSPTPKQWDIIKEELNKVSDNIGTPVGIGGWGTTTPPMTITTTPGTGYITTFNPVQFGTGSLSTTTSTATSLPFGSNVTYTNGGNDIKD